MNKQYDLVVIGGGSGGVRAARIAAGHGARVAICEEFRYGGTCVIRGCVPKKLMVYAAHFREEFEDAAAYGWNSSVDGFDWATLIKNKDQEIDRLNLIYESLLRDAGVELFHERARLSGPNKVQVGNQLLDTDTVLIATGGMPFTPGIDGGELGITSNEVFHLEQLPQRVVVVGGGYIAVEFAGIFNGLGSHTSLLYRGPQILRGFDQSVRDHLAAEMIKKGVDLRLQSSVEKIELAPSGQRIVSFSDGSRELVDCVLFATGRQPNTNNIGLLKAGVELGAKGEIKVNQSSQSNVENVFAVGDVTDRIALTPVATMEGHAFADSVYGSRRWQPDHHNVPSAVFSQPPVASVGLSEEVAREQLAEVQTYTSNFRILKHSLTENSERTLMKLVVDANTDRVVGAHLVGADAAEIMQGVAIAIKAGATKTHFDSTVGIHPSSAEEFCTMRTPDQ